MRKSIGFLVCAMLTLCIIGYRVYGKESRVSLMNLFPVESPAGGKPLSIYIETISPEYNSEITPNKCSDCSCSFENNDDLEPLIHCLIKKSPFITTSKKDATFIFTPIYTNHRRANNMETSLSAIQNMKDDEAFKRWKGCRHLTVDSFKEQREIDNFLEFSDQHLVITTNMTIELIRSNRWMNSRHILVPPLQWMKQYPKTDKQLEILCIGNSPEAVSFAKDNNIPIYEKTNNKAELARKMQESKFTVIFAGEGIEPFLIYEAIRSMSIPVLVSGPFLPAFANTHINYSKISIRTDANSVMSRIRSFNMDGVAAELTKASKLLMWPLDGASAAIDNAGGVLFDYLNTRHRVLRPVLRRTFIGSDQYIP